MRSLFQNIFSIKESGDNNPIYFAILISIFTLGFLIRLFACHNTFIVNPDGVLYINQAKAMYFGQWGELTSCIIGYVSNYPILIVSAYTIFGDWILAAKAVSLLFGSMTLIPLYLLLRRFFDKEISMLSTLLFAVIPVFVGRSADVVRGPIYWFFLALGLYFFVRSGDKRYRLLILLSCLSFLIAAWARVEAILVIVMSFFYILAVRQEKKLEKLAIFVMPVIFFLLFVLASPSLLNVPSENIFRLSEVGGKFTAPFVQYGNLRVSLAELADKPVMGISVYFLHKVRKLVWLIALGTVFGYLVKAFFYPFFAIFILGLGGMWTRIKGDSRVLYLSLLCISALVLFYLQLLTNWIMAERFFALFVLPSFIFVGFGLEKIILFLRTRLNFKGSVALLLVSLLILALALPKNLKSRERDKTVFKEIGQFIASSEGPSGEIEVAASRNSVGWISFYANLEYPGAPCPYKYMGLEKIMGNNYNEFVRNLRRENIRYFLWEERYWATEKFDFLKERNPNDFKELGRWNHPDTGRMILFKLI
jgi:4-amino-4-deoxy-L-arabinose transferase-like glycosyltransferase